MKRLLIALVATAMVAAGPALAEEVVFRNVNDNGWFAPFDSSTPAGVKYGDSGWLSPSQPETFTLVRLDLGLVAQDGTVPGTTDIVLTFNDGDPSGLVFGSGATLYQTVIEDVELPAGAGAQFFTLSIALPNVETLGGFNNVGWSVGVENFDFDGSFGFQASSANGQRAGFYTNNASFFDGNSWSLFAFGSDPTFGVANFVAEIYTPEPTSLAGVLLGALLIVRRR